MTAAQAASNRPACAGPFTLAAIAAIDHQIRVLS
jgi:hypothetical protein